MCHNTANVLLHRATDDLRHVVRQDFRSLTIGRNGEYSLTCKFGRFDWISLSSCNLCASMYRTTTRQSQAVAMTKKNHVALHLAAVLCRPVRSSFVCYRIVDYDNHGASCLHLGRHKWTTN
jgi:hypothetical protein